LKEVFQSLARLLLKLCSGARTDHRASGFVIPGVFYSYLVSCNCTLINLCKCWSNPVKSVGFWLEV